MIFLKNSLKEIHLRQEEFPHAWEVKAGNFVRFSFIDTGLGLGKELKKRIFDPYFTTKEPGKSTGIGLSIKMLQIRPNIPIVLCRKYSSGRVLINQCVT